MWLSDFNELEDVLGEHPPNPLTETDCSGLTPREAAAAARKSLRLDEMACVPDLCEILERAGVKVLLKASAMRAFFGLSVGPSDGGPALAVNNEAHIPVERRIFTAAHELGHLVLHASSFVADEVIEDEQQEKEANDFAAHFLMPHAAFEQVWHENRGLHWVDSVLHSKRRFRVSYKTVLRRLIESGAADSTIYSKFAKAYQARYRKQLKYRDEPDVPVKMVDEPSRLVNDDFVEDRLSRLVRAAVERDLISIGRAAEILDISLMEMRERIREWEVFG